VGINAPIKLAWKDNSPDEEGFTIVRRDPGSSQFKTIKVTGPNVQEFTDSSNKPAGVYAYFIYAFSHGCTSVYSNTISVRVGPPQPQDPSAPKGMRKIN
jgi:hypothetical protein